MNPGRGDHMHSIHDDQYSGDLPATPAELADDASPAISHEVIASYIAEAVRSVEGVVDLHTSPWRGLSSRRREIQTGGVELKDSGAETVDAEIHVSVAWGAVIPELARRVDEAVRERVLGIMNIELGTVTLYVDEIAGPMEVGSPQEG